MKDWYERRDELREGDEFLTHAGERVELLRGVPGDGTKWYVATWWNGSYAYMDDTIEPGELKERFTA
jgi:hypothetical protein